MANSSASSPSATSSRHARRRLRLPPLPARRLRAARPRAGRLALRLLPQAGPHGAGRHRGDRPPHRRRARQLVRAGGGLLPEPIPGYPARIIDGNVLSGTEHRIEPLRTTWSAGLPGMSLAIYEPATGTITELILEEDAHTQERALFGPHPDRARPALHRRPQLLRPLAVVPHHGGPRPSSWSAGIARRCRSAPPAGCTGGGGAAAARSSSRRSRSPMTMGSPTPCDGSC